MSLTAGVRSSKLVLGIPLVLASCTGVIEGATADSPAGPPALGGSAARPVAGGDQPPIPAMAPAAPPPEALQGARCDQSVRGTTELSVRRLTKHEVIASLTALFGATVMKDPAVLGSLAKLPEQPSVTNAEFDNDIVDVEGLEAVATEIVGVLFKTPGAVGQVLGGCDLAQVARCTDALVGPFATRAFRRPALPQTQQSVRDLVGKIGGPEGLKHGIVRVLTSPFFHQQIELGENPDAVVDGAAPRIRLTQHEVATRLAFQLTGAPPDETLLATAAAGALRDVEAVRAHARRLVGTAAARENWRRLVGEWLGISQTPDPHAAVAREVAIGELGLGREAQEEFLRFAAHVAYDKRGTVRDLFTEKIAFPYTSRLAKALGLPLSGSAQPVSNGLGGLVLRPAILMSGTTVTSPILRAVYVHRKILCQALPEPDPNAVDARVMETASLSHKDVSNREYFTILTSAPECVACHAVINPLGFTMESFGPLGAPRQREILYDDKGPTGITHAIDTAVDDIRIDGERRPAANAAETMAHVAGSAKAKSCLNAALIVNTRYRPLDATDACLMSELGAVQDANGPVLDALVASVANEGIFWRTARGVK